MASIRKRNDTYTIRVSLGYDSNGKQIQKFMTWKPPQRMTENQIKKELEWQKVLFEEQCRNGQYMDGNIKFSEFAEYWLTEYAQKQLRPETLAVYSELLKRILPAIGHIKLVKLQPQHLMEFYNNLSEEGIRQDIKYTAKTDIRPLLKSKKLTHKELAERAGVCINTIKSYVHCANISKKSAVLISDALGVPTEKLFCQTKNSASTLSQNTISKYHRLISSMLEKAVKWQIIMYNPCRRVETPKVQRKETKCLDDEETARLIDCLRGEPLKYQAMIITLLYSGMRRGELCGLEWSDIDFKSGLININKSSLYTSGRGVYDDTTKNESSKRVIKIPPLVLNVLKQHKREQTLERLKLGDAWEGTNKVFTQWNGKPIHPDTVSGWFSGFLKRHRLPHISVHGLRHTNATLLIAGGSDLRTISKRLGHSNMSTTANIYTHAIQSADERAAQLLDDMLNVRKI